MLNLTLFNTLLLNKLASFFDAILLSYFDMLAASLQRVRWEG